MAWAAWKDAFYNIVVARTTELDDATLGDTLDASHLERLLRLDDPAVGFCTDPSARLVLADRGYDLGRLVYGRHIRHDALADALDHLIDVMTRSGYGRFEVLEVFHRRADIVFHGPREAGAAPSDGEAPEPEHGSPDADASNPGLRAVEVFLAGVFRGAFEAAFNCHAYITRKGERTWHVRLGDGLGAHPPAPGGRGAPSASANGPPREEPS